MYLFDLQITLLFAKMWCIAITLTLFDSYHALYELKMLLLYSAHRYVIYNVSMNQCIVFFSSNHLQNIRFTMIGKIHCTNVVKIQITLIIFHKFISANRWPFNNAWIMLCTYLPFSRSSRRNVKRTGSVSASCDCTATY